MPQHNKNRPARLRNTQRNRQHRQPIQLRARDQQRRNPTSSTARAIYNLFYNDLANTSAASISGVGAVYDFKPVPEFNGAYIDELLAAGKHDELYIVKAVFRDMPGLEHVVVEEERWYYHSDELKSKEEREKEENEKEKEEEKDVKIEATEESK